MDEWTRNLFSEELTTELALQNSLILSIWYSLNKKFIDKCRRIAWAVHDIKKEVALITYTKSAFERLISITDYGAENGLELISNTVQGIQDDVNILKENIFDKYKESNGDVYRICNKQHAELLMNLGSKIEDALAFFLRVATVCKINALIKSGSEYGPFFENLKDLKIFTYNFNGSELPKSPNEMIKEAEKNIKKCKKDINKFKKEKEREKQQKRKKLSGKTWLQSRLSTQITMMSRRQKNKIQRIVFSGLFFFNLIRCT